MRPLMKEEGPEGLVADSAEPGEVADPEIDGLRAVHGVLETALRPMPSVPMAACLDDANEFCKWASGVGGSQVIIGTSFSSLLVICELPWAGGANEAFDLSWFHIDSVLSAVLFVGSMRGKVSGTDETAITAGEGMSRCRSRKVQPKFLRYVAPGERCARTSMCLCGWIRW